LERIQYSVNCLLEAGVLVDDLPPILKKVSELFSDLTQKNLDSKLEFLLKVGLGSGALGKAIARRPNILNYSLDSMSVAFKYLATLMVTRDVPKLVKRYAEVLVLDPQRKMAPMVNYLISLGVQREKLGKVILRRPQLLGYTILGLQPTVQYLVELGVKPELLGKVVSTSPQVCIIVPSSGFKSALFLSRGDSFLQKCRHGIPLSLACTGEVHSWFNLNK
jgi:hypothetical protein